MIDVKIIAKALEPPSQKCDKCDPECELKNLKVSFKIQGRSKIVTSLKTDDIANMARLRSLN